MFQFVFFWFLCIFSFGGSFQADSPAVSISSNATSVQVGQSIKLTCAVANYQQHEFGVHYYRDNDDVNDPGFCHYAIEDQQNATFKSNRNLSDVAYHALSWAYPLYEITLTPSTVGSHAYRCNLYENGKISIYSANLKLTATPPPPPPPSAILSSNVTSVPVNHPFTISCTFANFTPLPVDYVVRFSSLRDGPLAVVEVTNGTALLDDLIKEGVEVTSGERDTFPVFDLVISEKVDTSTAYWCELDQLNRAPVRSNTWPALVHFTGSKLAENQRTGACAVAATGLDLSGKTYSVQFWSDQGPKAVNLLAEYLFKPKHIEEFKANPQAPWTSIRHGSSRTWPEFSILANGTSLHGTWWCLLAVGATREAPDYREFVSNKADL